VIGRPVTRVSSFGGLYHFRPDRRPAGATERCLDCPVERECAYSAVRIYRRFVDDPAFRRWPLPVLTDDVSAAGVDRALRDGPYGLCVYLGLNDVVDHQVVNLEYTDGVTASFTMTAFTPAGHRKTSLFGTGGAIEGDGKTLRVHDFRTDTVEVFDTAATAGASAAGGHGGADRALVRAFLAAVATGDRTLVTSGPEDSIASHRVVWAAEHARRTGTVVHIG
jgi:predicted dehydrogenase